MAVIIELKYNNITRTCARCIDPFGTKKKEKLNQKRRTSVTETENECDRESERERNEKNLQLLRHFMNYLNNYDRHLICVRQENHLSQRWWKMKWVAGPRWMSANSKVYRHRNECTHGWSHFQNRNFQPWDLKQTMRYNYWSSIQTLYIIMSLNKKKLNAKRMSEKKRPTTFVVLSTLYRNLQRMRLASY